ncbi:hypothetical protein [Mesorhizobium sp. M1D.F.Ca.ET.043.01.1.1]|uniref:hypothetical protein n=1 Tax=unclassified Mesorhizobium TaxID=325217 RepID=UPI0026A79AF4
MAKGINIGDEVAITAKVRRRVTEGRVSLLRTASLDCRSDLEDEAGSGDRVRGDVTRVDEGKVTINLGIPVTVSADTVRLVTPYNPPARKTPLADKPS